MALLSAAVLLLMFKNNMKTSRTLLSVNLAEHLQVFKKMCLIYSDNRITDNNTNKEVGAGLYEMNCARKRLIERREYYEIGKSSKFYKALLSNRSNKSNKSLCNRSNLIFLLSLYITIT